MGIELPAPNGEALIGTPTGAERTATTYTAERQSNPNFVEQNSTERPAPQELRTGQGAGNGSPVQAYTDASNTTVAIQSAAISTTLSLDDVPVVAADEDLIEKQWVDSAKRIIKDTRNDPFSQGEAISRLQADYLQKRYGKVVSGSGS